MFDLPTCLQSAPGSLTKFGNALNSVIHRVYYLPSITRTLLYWVRL